MQGFCLRAIPTGIEPKWGRNQQLKITLADTVLSSIVDFLVEKGIITEEEYEKRIKEIIKVK
jgi:polyhydroxyalkanoate synthesis regulator phasin